MLQASLPPSAQAGGVGYQVDLLATALSHRGHDVTMFVVDDPPVGRPYRCVQVPGGRGRSRHLLGVPRSFARLDLSEFDAVHAHGDDWLLGRQPRVRTFYGSALMEARTATRWLRRGSQLYYYGQELISSLNPHATAISESTRRCLPLVRTCVPCGFDPRVFFAGGDRTPYPSILFVAGTMSGRKRGAVLMRAFEEVRQQIPEAQLTVVSRDRAAGTGVTSLADVDAAALGDLYRSHWLLCSSSSYEGFGVPYVEAMASGLPIVTTPNRGAEEVLGNGALAVFASPDDLGRSLVAAINDTDRRVELSRLGIEAAKRYPVDVVASRYEELYRRVATDRASIVLQE